MTTPRGYGQQFFATPPARLPGDGPRRFGSREEWQRAWRDVPATWKDPVAGVTPAADVSDDAASDAASD